MCGVTATLCGMMKSLTAWAPPDPGKERMQGAEAAAYSEVAVSGLL
jgi:hypothetical protein